jgi:hypothetical protein
MVFHYFKNRVNKTVRLLWRFLYDLFARIQQEQKYFVLSLITSNWHNKIDIEYKNNKKALAK